MAAQSNSQTFTCQQCKAEFSMAGETLKRYPGWVPTRCPQCFNSGRGAERGAVQGRLFGGLTPAPTPTDPLPDGGGDAGQLAEAVELSGEPGQELSLALEQVLEACHEGPKEGVFTDGGCHGNPGPGGWAAVVVRDDQVVQQRYGRDPHTTNNRMELMALIAAFEMIEPDEQLTVWSDSQLCVNTVNLWAKGWERRGWRRKGGPIKNLELVKRLYALARARPGAKLTWIKAHAGRRWNEYVDTLADPEMW